MTAKATSLLCVLALSLPGAASFPLTASAAEPPPPPIVHILATDPCGAEAGSDPATFAVIRSGPTNEPLTVFYRVGGSAENGVDYAELSGQVTIRAGAWRASLVVRPVDDALVEGGESILIELVQPLSWPPPYLVCWPSFAFGHIEDNDFEPTNRPPAVALVNPPDGSVFVAPVDIPLVARASDPDGRVRAVEFFDGTNSLGVVRAPIPLPEPEPLDGEAETLDFERDPSLFPDLEADPRLEPVPLPPNVFRLVWSNAPPGRHVLTVVATDNLGASTRSEPVHITVLEPPTQPVVTVKATDPEAAEPDALASRINTATFTIHRSGGTDFPLTVYYRLSGSASNGVDYRELPGTATIPRGERAVDVHVVPLDDNLVEGDEKVVLTLLPAICIDIFPPPPDCYLLGRERVARAVIHDNDRPNVPPVVALVRPEDGAVFRAPADITIVAAARDYDGRVVSVEFFEGTNSLGVVTHHPTTITNTRPPFALTWSNVPPGRYLLSAVATDNDGAQGHSRPVVVHVVGIVEPPVVNIVATDPVASEPGILTVIDTATFNVSRTGPADRPLTVFYSIGGTASNGVDYRPLAGRVTLATGAASSNIVVDPLDDRLVEGLESVVLKLEEPPFLAASLLPLELYRIGSNGVARAVIRDNDTAPTNLPPKVAIVRPEDGDVFVAPADITIYAVAADADGYVQTVEFFANGTSLGVVSNSLSAGNTTGATVPEQLFRLHWPDVPAGAYALTAKATDNRGAMAWSEPVRIRVADPQPPVVTLHARDPFASEGDPVETLPERETNTAFIGPPIVISNDVPDTATFVVKRSGGTNVDLVVHYRVSGTASNGADYRLLSGRVTIPRGAWAAEIVVDPIDDRLPEATETVVVTLEPIACPRVVPPPPECYLVGDPDRAVAYIRDNEPNQAPKVEIVEPANEQSFPAGADIPIVAVTRDPDGWVGKVEFFAGTNRIGVQEILFIVPPPPGQLQRFSMVWSNVPPGRYALTAKATDDQGAMSVSEPVRITVIEVTRLPVVTIEAVDPVATEQDPRLDSLPDNALFKVSRTGPTDRPLKVYYHVGGTASNGVDYVRLSGELEIPQNESAAAIVVEAMDDELVELTESVVLALEPPAHCLASDPPVFGCYLVGTPGRAVAYLRDNDAPANKPPTVAIVNPPDGSVFTAPVDLRLVAAAADPDGWVATVEFFDGANSLGVVTNDPRVLDPIALADAGGATLAPDLRPLNPFFLLWSNVPPGHHVLTAVATDNAGAATRSEPIEIKVIAEPDQTIVNIVARDPLASEGCLDATVADCPPDTATFVVTRRGPTNEALVVYYRIGGTAANGVDYRELPHAVRIPAGTLAAPIIVVPIDDRLVEGPESVVIALVEPPCLLAADILPRPPDCYEVGRNHTARAVIYDNDAPPNRPPAVALVEPEDGAVFLAPADIRLVARAGDADGEVVLVEFFEGTNKVGMATGPSPDGLYYARWVAVPAGRYVLTAVATDNQGASAESAPIEIKVTDRLPPPVVNLFATDPEGREIDPRLDIPEDPAAFTVTRTGPTNNPLTVFFRLGGTASNGVDYQFLRGHVTIPAGESRAAIFVQVLDDLLCEGDESVVLGLIAHPAIADFPPPLDYYLVGSNGVARAVIHDNELCPTNLPPVVAIVRPEDGAVFEAPADIPIYAEAHDRDGAVVQVEFFANDRSLGVVRASSNTQEIFRLLWEDVPAGGYALTAVATDNRGLSARSEPVRLRVIEPPVRTVVTIVATDPTATEGPLWNTTSDPAGLLPRNDTATFTVTRSGGTNIPLTVRYRLSGTASNGVDYRALNGEVTIPTGAWSARIVVDPMDDNLVEGTETVVATLLPPVCLAIFPPPPDCYVVGDPSEATAYIRDNDSAPNLPPRVEIAQPADGETFIAPADIEIVAHASDPDGWVTEIVFYEGTNQIGGLAILVSEPPPPGQLQTFRFTWPDVRPGAYELSAVVTDNRGARARSEPVRLRVVDPCLVPVVTVSATDPVASEQDARLGVPPDTATFTVRRTCRLSEPLRVEYRLGGLAENGVDYWRLTGEVFFQAGQEAARVVVVPVDDDLVEGTESVVLALVQPPCANTDPAAAGCYLVGRPGSATAYLRDNDTLAPRVAIVSPPDGAVFDAPANIPILAHAVDPDGWVPLVEFFADGVKIGEASVYFLLPPPPGQLQEFTIRWTSVPAGRYVLTAKATDSSGALGWSAPVHVTVQEPPLIPVVTIVATDALAREGTTNTAAFRVRRSGSTNEDLTVFYEIAGTAQNGVDYTRIPDRVTIPAGRRSASILITPVDDRLPEGIETVLLRLVPAALYNVGRPGRAGAVIVDNDRPPPDTLRLADGCVHVRRDAPRGFCYRLEASRDLLRWETVLSATVVDDAIHFVDDEAGEQPLRFFRVMPEAPLLDDE
jgi:hypothetical protein